MAFGVTWLGASSLADHAVLLGVGTDDHHAESHAIGSHSDVATAVKSADESVNNSDVLQNDDDLLVPVAANTDYVFILDILAVSVTATPDLKVGWSVPAGATMTWAMVGDIEQNYNSENEGGTDIQTLTSSLKYTRWVGTVQVAGTSGNLQLQWAQTAATAEDTTVKAGSMLRLITSS